LLGSIDYLYNFIGKNAPNWVYKKEYKLDNPYFPSGLKGDIRAIMCIESPIEFKSKNIFVLANVLERC